MRERERKRESESEKHYMHWRFGFIWQDLNIRDGEIGVVQFDSIIGPA